MKKRKNVYIAGDCLKVGAQMLRARERDDIQALEFDVYNPSDNKEINDKSNLTNDLCLAEKIVKQDTKGIRNSDIIVVEPTNDACGSMVELGQLKGMKDVANDIRYIIDNAKDSEIAILSILEIINPIINQKVFPHYEDIRRFKGCHEYEDSRAWGCNQYVYGVCLDLSDNKGFYEWEEILEELKQIKQQEESNESTNM